MVATKDGFQLECPFSPGQNPHTLTLLMVHCNAKFVDQDFNEEQYHYLYVMIYYWKGNILFLPLTDTPIKK